MRPVDKGESPRKYSQYQDARADLIRRIGQYCSYCEQKIPAGLHVEYVKPKAKYTELEKEWSNFLLACVNCNSNKGDSDVDLNTYLWPQIFNPMLGIEYDEHGRVLARPGVEPKLMGQAEKLIKLCGLDKTPANNNRASDRRWLNRQQAWRKAKDAKKDLGESDTPAMRRRILCGAVECGFFSVWFSVFADDEQLKSGLIIAFTGTAKNAFDIHSNAIPRQT